MSKFFLFLAALERLQPRSPPAAQGSMCPLPGGFCPVQTAPARPCRARTRTDVVMGGDGDGDREAPGSLGWSSPAPEGDSWRAGRCSGSRWDSGKHLHFASLVLANGASQYNTSSTCTSSLPLDMGQPSFPNSPYSPSSSFWMQISEFNKKAMLQSVLATC